MSFGNEMRKQKAKFTPLLGTKIKSLNTKPYSHKPIQKIPQNHPTKHPKRQYCKFFTLFHKMVSQHLRWLWNVPLFKSNTQFRPKRTVCLCRKIRLPAFLTMESERPVMINNKSQLSLAVRTLILHYFLPRSAGGCKHVGLLVDFEPNRG